MNQNEKKTGTLRLEHEIGIPCGATVNKDDTFNTKLMAKIGETMYVLSPRDYVTEFDEDGTEYLGRMIIDRKCIYKVVIARIDYTTDCGVVLEGITEEGAVIGAVQELFFASYEEAVKGIEEINEYYDQNPKGDWIFDSPKFCNRYKYILQFPLKPQEIILIDTSLYVANRVIVDIYPDKASVHYQTYEDGMLIITEQEYNGFSNQYEIVKLIEEKEEVVDM